MAVNESKNKKLTIGRRTYLSLAMTAAAMIAITPYALASGNYWAHASLAVLLEFYTVRDAALAGFAWESLVNKLLARPVTKPEPGRRCPCGSRLPAVTIARGISRHG
jgi:hypothetical protein